MSDEYVVVVTTDESLVRDIQNATTMDVIHVSNHDTASEKNYRRKIVILDPESIPTTEAELTKWGESTNYLIVTLTTYDDTFVKLHAKSIYDVWYLPINVLVLKKRLAILEASIDVDGSMSIALYDLRQCITMITLNATMLTDEKIATRLTDNRREKLIDQIQNTITRTFKVFTCLEQWTSYRKPSIELEPEWFSLENLITYIGYDYFLDDKKLPPLELTIQDKLPEIFADRQQIKTVLVNLFSSMRNSKPSFQKVNLSYSDETHHIEFSTDKELAYYYGKYLIIEHISNSSLLIQAIKQHRGNITINTDDNSVFSLQFTIPDSSRNR